MLGVTFSIDEMTIRFKVHYARGEVLRKNQKVMDYRHIIFARKDTHIKYLCAMIFVKKYLAKSIFPLHARLVAIFYAAEEKHHQCAMDHLYNSAAFFKAA